MINFRPTVMAREPRAVFLSQIKFGWLTVFLGEIIIHCSTVRWIPHDTRWDRHRLSCESMAHNQSIRNLTAYRHPGSRAGDNGCGACGCEEQ